MMDKLKTEIRHVVGKEYVRACNEYGETFTSLHEGYGVLAEEVQEATEEEETVMSGLGHLLYTIRQGEPTEIENTCTKIERHARLAACEYCQVAAMARKIIATLHTEV